MDLGHILIMVVVTQNIPMLKFTELHTHTHTPLKVKNTRVVNDQEMTSFGKVMITNAVIVN